MATAHSTFKHALGDRGWTLVESGPVIPGGGPNPSDFVIRHGRVVLRLLVYGWNITGEGKGRTKTDFRVQTTRSHEGDLMAEDGWTSVGLGWDEGRGVLAAFDPWAKRTGGRSNSVHITRDLLDRAADDGWATEQRDDGPECAFQPLWVERFLEWSADLEKPRFLRLSPDSFQMDGVRCRVTVRPRSGDPALTLRPNDHFTIATADPPEPGVWQIASVETERTSRESGRQQVQLVFDGRLVGRLKTAS